MSATRVAIPSPASQVREHLERMRQAVLPFRLAWKRAFERVRWPDEKTVRDEWKTVLSEGQPLWEDAYCGRGVPARGLPALTAALLADDASERQPLEVLA